MATHGLDKHYALGAHINAKGSWAEGKRIVQHTMGAQSPRLVRLVMDGG